MRREVESMATAIADSIRDADAQHAGLVEAVHKRVMARIAQQGDVASVVQEALESKRAFLEEVVRAEIASRLKEDDRFIRNWLVSPNEPQDKCFLANDIGDMKSTSSGKRGMGIW